LLTCGGYFASMLLVNFIPPFGLYHVFTSLFSSASFWFSTILISLVALLPFFLDRYWRWNYSPFEYQKRIRLVSERKSHSRSQHFQLDESERQSQFRISD